VAGKKGAPTRAVARACVGLPAGYASFLDGLKARIRAAQVKAALAVNAELVLLYWRIGRDILARQEREGWGRASSTGSAPTFGLPSPRCGAFRRAT
jgi:hypothetical protein